MKTLKLEDRLCFTLYALSRQFTQLYWPHLDKLALTYPQYLVLQLVDEQPNLSVREVGHKLWLDSGTLTPILKRLANKSLLQRQRDPADERVVRINLTAEGRLKLAESTQIPAAIHTQLPVTQEQFHQLMPPLQALLARMDSPSQR